MFDYGRTPARWTMVEDDWSAAEATDGDTIAAADHRPADRHRGQPRPRASHAERGRGALRRARLAPRPERTRALRERQASACRRPFHYWRNWLAGGRFPDHRWRQHLQRSALTLKGLTYAPTGATVAAATTSLPETPGGERNWDYRYCWMRDATFTLWGLHALGLDWEADDFMQFVADLERDEDGGAADHVRARRRARPAPSRSSTT